MTATTTYRVVVTREGGHWLADVPELEGSQTYATNLTALDRYVREVIVLGADLPDEAMPDLSIAYTFDLDDDLVTQADRARQEREELARRDRQLQDSTKRLAQQLTAHGYSVRDAGHLLGLAHQRVSQLLSDNPAGESTTGPRRRRPAKAAPRYQLEGSTGPFVKVARKAPARKAPARKAGTPGSAANEARRKASA